MHPFIRLLPTYTYKYKRIPNTYTPQHTGRHSPVPDILSPEEVSFGNETGRDSWD